MQTVPPRHWQGEKRCTFPCVAQARIAMKPFSPWPAARGLEGDASTGGAGTRAEVGALYGRVQ